MRRSGWRKTISATVTTLLITGGVWADDAAPPLKLGAPPPSEAPQGHEFDFWIGHWDVVQKHWREGEWVVVPGSQMIVKPVLNGTALVEHFRGPNGLGFDLLGFSLRAYDPVKETWVVLLRWPAPGGGGSFWSMEGGFHHNRCETSSAQRDAQGNERMIRYTFSDSIDGYYRWNSGVSTDGGETWAQRFIMEGVRRNPAQDGEIELDWLHDLQGEPRSTQQEFRELDFLDGKWEAKVSIEESAGIATSSTIRLTVDPIVGRTAQLMHYARKAPDGTVHEAVAVQGYDASVNQWLMYQLNSFGRMRRYEGALADNAMVFLQTKEEGDERPLERLTWEKRADGTIGMTIESSPDDGTTWQQRLSGSFHPTRGAN